jgi:hypothetical protein
MCVMQRASAALHSCLFGTKAARKMNLKKDRLEVLAITRPLKPFEEPCPRIRASWPRPIQAFLFDVRRRQKIQETDFPDRL